MSEEKWKCPKCGTENAGDDNFCGECGGKKPESSVWKCPNCGKQDVKSKFCPACGTKRPESKNILTPEQMKAKLEEELEKRRRDLAANIYVTRPVTISSEHPLVAKIPPTKFELTQDGLIISHGGTGLSCFIGEVLPNGDVKPTNGWSCDFRVRDGIIYLLHNGKEEKIGRITEEMKERSEKRKLENTKLIENFEKMRRKELEEKLKC